MGRLRRAPYMASNLDCKSPTDYSTDKDISLSPHACFSYSLLTASPLPFVTTGIAAQVQHLIKINNPSCCLHHSSFISPSPMLEPAVLATGKEDRPVAKAQFSSRVGSRAVRLSLHQPRTPHHRLLRRAPLLRLSLAEVGAQPTRQVTRRQVRQPARQAVNRM